MIKLVGPCVVQLGGNENLQPHDPSWNSFGMPGLDQQASAQHQHVSTQAPSLHKEIPSQDQQVPTKVLSLTKILQAMSQV